MQLISIHPETALSGRHIKVLNDMGRVIGHIHYLEKVNGSTGYQYCPIRVVNYKSLDLLDTIQNVLVIHLKLPEPNVNKLANSFQKLITRGTPCPHSKPLRISHTRNLHRSTFDHHCRLADMWSHHPDHPFYVYMAQTSNIEWTDATWNPITGCSIWSPGCTNCYAMKIAGTANSKTGFIPRWVRKSRLCPPSLSDFACRAKRVLTLTVFRNYKRAWRC